MTALAGMSDLRRFDEEFALTNELRTRGLDHLLTASEAVGVRRFVAQSYTGWPNERVGGPVKTESDPLDPDPPAQQRRSIEAIGYLERAVTSTAPIEGVVLRYGEPVRPRDVDGERVRRPRPGAEVPARRRRRRHLVVHPRRRRRRGRGRRALERGAPGVYNIVDDEPAPVAEWLPYLAECLGAQPPRHVPAWIARLAIGEVGVSMMTADPRLVERQGQARARLGAALAELARRVCLGARRHPGAYRGLAGE